MATLTDLNNFDLLQVSGIDASRFLQGQLSCNIDKLGPTQSLNGAYCNIKGRVISDLQVLQMEDSIFLLCASGMGATLKQTLDKYIVFSKAETSLVTAQYQSYGIHGDDATTLVDDLFGGHPEGSGAVLGIEDGVVIALPDLAPRYRLLLKNQQKSIDILQQKGITDDLQEWELADIRQGIVHVTPATQESYTPQLLNYDINGTIDFRKGCYTGQEIVARMHYRGVAKKRLYRASVQHTNPSPGTVVKHENNAVGEVVSAALVSGDLYELLAILPSELVEQNAEMTLHEDGAEGSKLTLLPLPQ